MQSISGRAPRRPLMPLALVMAPLAVSSLVRLHCQTTPVTADNPAALPKFDVVSIRPAKENCAQASGAFPSGDAFHINCLPLDAIIKIAYGINTDDLITGEPDWIKSTSFDITAKIDPADTAAFSKFKLHDFGLMLQPVLRDRFELRTHYEPQQRTVYTLAVAKGGSKLKESLSDPSGKNVPMLKMPKWGEMECRNCAIGAIPMVLSQWVGGTVVNETGLKGTYDFTLEFAPDPTRTDDARPSIFTAIQEQLGLKLLAKKETTNVLVIDHVEQPSAN